MKILIVSTSDINGGAARAAYRLHKALLIKKIDSKMIVQNKSSDDFTVLSQKSKLQMGLNRLRAFLDKLLTKFYKGKTKTLFSPSLVPFSNIVDEINRISPDIVHLHWICGGMLSIKDLSKINSKIVWNCHDMWPFTGGCHYDEECNQYKNKCSACKVLNTNNNFLSQKVFNEKIKVYNRIKNLTIIGSSKWISKCAKDSVLFQNRSVITLPNCIDTSLFKPIDKTIARDIFNIPHDKKVILFGAMNSLGDPRKGAKELFEAIKKLKVKDVIIVIAGSSKPEFEIDLPFQIYYIPPLNDEASLPLMYNVADVMIVPSLQENLANSIVESLSCGVPVVAFDIGGNKDMIDHKINGYLAKAYQTDDLAFGIEWILKNYSYDKLIKNSRKKVLDVFDSNIVAEKYIKIYNNLGNE